MHLLHELKNSIDPRTLIEQFSYIGVFVIVFAESGLFFGFFLPGDSLLIIAGVLAASGILHLWLLALLVLIAAFLGDQVGYWTGNKLGRRLFQREDSLIFKKHYVTESEAFFAKHGNKTVILGRFVPIVRTFTPILAGIGDMPYGTFVTYNLIGAILWGIGITGAGYLLGNAVPNIDKYITAIVVVIIILSVIPPIWHLVKNKKK